MERLRIGNGCGFWGDNADAPVLLAEHGKLDYLTLEYLAELTMSILGLQKQRDPDAGFARDFIDVLERLVPILRAQPRLKIVTNAGGMNPSACAARARAVLDGAGLADRRIATVAGDDLLPRLDELLAAGHAFANLDTGQPLAAVRPRVVSVNAYLGARPIVEALGQGASVVITGRVADASLTVAPAVNEFGWGWTDWDRLASATVAGHLIECGAQATGGLWCNWQEAPDLGNVGYPLVEIDRSGALAVMKPSGTGGAVNLETVAEQLLYEVGDPAGYLTPDVVADFTSVSLRQTGPNVVSVDAAKGKPATDTFKVSIAYRDGFAASGTLVIFGPGAPAKARRCGEMILERLGRAGVILEHQLIECLGAGDCVPGVVSATAEPPEVVLRVSVRDSRRAAVERFTREFAPLVTSGPPGVTGYTTGRPAVREVFAYWPALVAKEVVRAEVRGQGGLRIADCGPCQPEDEAGTREERMADSAVNPHSALRTPQSKQSEIRVPLSSIAHGRSGDKGNHANVAVIAYTPTGFAWLRAYLTEEVVRAYFASLQPSRVVRYEAANLLAVNFVLHDVLAGGASRSLRSDTQGKTLALALLRMPIPRPENWSAMLRKEEP